MSKKKQYWTTCDHCKGLGRKKIKLRKKTRLKQQQELENTSNSNGDKTLPFPHKPLYQSCKKCEGSGLAPSSKPTKVDSQKYPHIAIIGAGIGGIALAIACKHRGIPFSLFERDENFEARSQGYGLTLQQASKALKELGILSLNGGITSTRHVVHTTDGNIIAEWGIRKWGRSNKKGTPNRTNIHIPRQTLRYELMKQLGDRNQINWNHKLISCKKTENNPVEISFDIDGKTKKTEADIIVGADGIRSTVRKIAFGENVTSLRYLDCMVILGICSLKNLDRLETPLLDSATVFQTANGTERIYMMPFTKDKIMWQLSFPISEKDAKKLSKQGSEALKKESCNRTHWHEPIPKIIANTNVKDIAGYPVYDRKLLTPNFFQNVSHATLIGDAAHPMSPFKGQGANQALLDALSLTRTITKGCTANSNWKHDGIRENILTSFEHEMMQRTANKVNGSAAAATILHSKNVLLKANVSRGSVQ